MKVMLGHPLQDYGCVKDRLLVETLSSESLVVLDGGKIVITPSCRTNLLFELHTFHQTADTMDCIACQIWFWPPMKHDLLQVWDKCQTNRKEKEIPPMIPNLFMSHLEPMDSL